MGRLKLNWTRNFAASDAIIPVICDFSFLKLQLTVFKKKMLISASGGKSSMFCHSDLACQMLCGSRANVTML